MSTHFPRSKNYYLVIKSNPSCLVLDSIYSIPNHYAQEPQKDGRQRIQACQFNAVFESLSWSQVIYFHSFLLQTLSTCTEGQTLPAAALHMWQVAHSHTLSFFISANSWVQFLLLICTQVCKSWKGCGERRMLVHSWWASAAVVEINVKVPQKTENKTMTCPALPLCAGALCPKEFLEQPCLLLLCSQWQRNHICLHLHHQMSG